MSDKTKNTFTIAWRTAALTLLSVVTYFVVERDKKLDFVYNFILEYKGSQIEINKNYATYHVMHFEGLKEMKKSITDFDEKWTVQLEKMQDQINENHDLTFDLFYDRQFKKYNIKRK